MGAKLIFFDVRGDGLKVQVMANATMYKGDNFEELGHSIKRGDIIGVEGKPGRTKTGELSVAPFRVQLLSPCLHMLPTAVSGLKDTETRYRQRYLDLIMNNRARDVFTTRSRIINFVRSYLDNLGFIEVIMNCLKYVTLTLSGRNPNDEYDCWRCHCQTFCYSSQRLKHGSLHENCS